MEFSSPKVTFYGNAICPFAHRGWMALKEKDIPHEFVHVPLSGELKTIETMGVEASFGWKDSGLSYEQILKIKNDYIANVNPSGAVPAVVCDGRIITEADVVAEFLDDRFPDLGTRLLPPDPFMRARLRTYHKILSGSAGVEAGYGLLKNQDPAMDVAKRDKVYSGLRQFVELADPEGPFFLGDTFSFADVMLAPFYDRFRYTLKEYRGVDMVPIDEQAHPWVMRFKKWASAIEARKSFKETALNKDHYVSSYKGYAGDRGKSQISQEATNSKL